MKRQGLIRGPILIQPPSRVGTCLSSQVVRRENPLVRTRGPRRRAHGGIRVREVKNQMELGIASPQFLKGTPGKLLDVGGGAGGRATTRGSGAGSRKSGVIREASVPSQGLSPAMGV